MAVAATLAMILAGCGGGAASSSSSATAASKASSSSSAKSSSSSASSSAAKAIKTIAVKETEFKLNPSKIVLNKPGTYAFKAEDKGTIQHSLEVEGKGVKAKEHEAELEKTLNPGQSGVLKVTFTKPGNYEIYCPVDSHEQQGMKGEVVVK